MTLCRLTGKRKSVTLLNSITEVTQPPGERPDISVGIMIRRSDYVEFGYRNEQPAHTAAYLLPAIMQLAPPLSQATRVLDVGCGNGYIAGQFAKRACSVVGIDLSDEGIEIARKTYPQARFEKLAADEQMLSNLNEPPFDLVISTEVVE